MFKQVKEVIAEILGRKDGGAHGIGGSMHLYKREHGFYGGCGIVGTHVRAAAAAALLAQQCPCLTITVHCPQLCSIVIAGLCCSWLTCHACPHRDAATWYVGGVSAWRWHETRM